MLEKRNYDHNKRFLPADKTGFINGQGKGENEIRVLPHGVERLRNDRAV